MCSDEDVSYQLPRLPPVDSPLKYCHDFANISLPPEVVAISPMVTI